ncbi:unnamed protein product, partial [Phaeothamnion confervicola]
EFVCKQDAVTVRTACKGMGTDDAALIEVICGRTKAHLKRVDLHFHALFERSLYEQIHSETSGHYKRLLEFAVMGEVSFLY